jgi:hypothetical protein
MTEVCARVVDAPSAAKVFTSSIRRDKGSGWDKKAFDEKGNGFFFAIVPTDTLQERVNQFELGGLFSTSLERKTTIGKVEPVENTLFNLASIIKYVSDKFGHIELIFREPYVGYSSRADNFADHVVRDNGKEFFFTNIDRFLSPYDIADIIDSHREVWSFLMFCYDPTEGGGGRQFRPDFGFCATSAYDGESFLCWISSNWESKLKLTEYRAPLYQPDAHGSLI